MMTLNKQSTHEMYKKSKITPPGSNLFRLFNPVVAAEDERITIDLDQAKGLVKQLDKVISYSMKIPTFYRKNRLKKIHYLVDNMLLRDYLQWTNSID